MIAPAELFLLFASGLAGGIISGLLGIGGGVIYILIFSLYIQRFSGNTISGPDMVSLLIANSVFALLFAGISGSLRQYKTGNFYWIQVLIIAIPGVVSSVVTAAFIKHIGVYDKQQFAVFFTLVMLPVIARMVWSRNTTNKPEITAKPIYLVAVGAFAGMVTALSGLGGGFIIVPVLSIIFGMPMKKAVSISLGVIASVACCFSIYNLFFTDYTTYDFHWTMGAILFPLVLPVVAGVLIGAPQGVQLSHRLPNHWHRIIFVLFTSGVIVKLLIDFL